MTQSTKSGLLAYMMISLQGAFRLLMGNINGLHYFSPGAQGAVLSFSSFFISMPVWFFMQTRWGIAGSGQAGFLPEILLSFGIHLTGIFLIYIMVNRICQQIQRAAYFPLYVTLQNWGLAVISIILLSVSFVIDVVDLPQTALFMLQSFIVALQVGYTFYLTKISLNISFWMAVGIVTLEILVNFMLAVAGFALQFGGQFAPDGVGFPAG
jgi:hypothetical protein